MERMEQRIRESLEARAHDVEPTPALWLEVDRRIERRRRVHAWSWALAGAAAVLVAVLGAPAVVGLLDGPERIEIPPLDRTPTTSGPTHVVAVGDDGVARLVDLAAGERARDLADLDFLPVDLTVSPTSTVDAVEFAAVGAAGELAVVGPGGEIWSGGGVAAADGFARSVVASPDGRWFASTTPTEESDGSSVIVAPPLTSWAAGPDTAWTEIGMVVDRRSRLVAWSGELAQEGDLSELWLVTGDGVLVRELLEVQGGLPVSVGGGPSDEVDWSVRDIAFGDGGRDAGTYLLVDDPAGPELVWLAADGSLQSTLLRSELGDAAAETRWLDASQDTVLVGNGERTWLVAHDPQAGFDEPVELARDTVRVAFLGTPRAGGAPSDEATDTDEPTPGDAGDAAIGEEPAVDGPTVDGVVLPAPVVTASLRELTLLGPDGPQVIAELAAEGESVFLSARVRPGSTVDDLTVVALTTAEGMWDLRTIRWVDGQQTAFEPFPPPYVPGGTGTAGDELSVQGPVWSPGGDAVAWLETATGGTTLVTVGWGGDGPGTGDTATDNASFEVDTLGHVPLVPAEWVATPDDDVATELRLAGLDVDGWFALPIDVQPDGARALPSATVVPRVEPLVGSTLGVASDATSSPRWYLQMTDTQLELSEPDPARPGSWRMTPLPEGLLPGDGLPELWVRAIGDGALVGSRNTATTFHLNADGTATRLPGEVLDADVVR
jgi:hypothetical protein